MCLDLSGSTRDSFGMLLLLRNSNPTTRRSARLFRTRSRPRLAAVTKFHNSPPTHTNRFGFDVAKTQAPTLFASVPNPVIQVSPNLSALLQRTHGLSKT